MDGFPALEPTRIETSAGPPGHLFRLETSIEPPPKLQARPREPFDSRLTARFNYPNRRMASKGKCLRIVPCLQHAIAGLDWRRLRQFFEQASLCDGFEL